MAGVVLLAIEERDGDIGALARESDGHRCADAAVTAGDQCLFALQLAMAAIAVLAVVRPRLHLRGLAGEGLLLGGEGRAWVVGQGHRHSPIVD